MASKDKRRRELATARQQRQEQRRAEAERRRRRRRAIIVGVTVGALVATMAVGLAVSLTSDPAPTPTAGTDDTGAVVTPEPTAQETGHGDGQDAAAACSYLDDAGDPSLVRDVGRPGQDPGDLGRLTAVMTLDGRDVTMDLDGSAAPCTANSWEFLAAADYFDDTVCHRLTTSPTLGVLQCGDPSGTGAGGPGYRFAEENLDGATYPAGTVAMANTGEPGSTGSQFFIVHSDSQLPPLYTVVGTVTDGLDVVTDIAEAGTVDSSTDSEPAAGAVVSDLVVERSER